MLTPLLLAALAGGPDYLIDPAPYVAEVRRGDGELVLTNGLVERVWRMEPNGACVALRNLTTDESVLRAVRPEARVTIDGVEYEVGGLSGQPNHAFLTDAWLDSMPRRAGSLQLVDVEMGLPRERLRWNARRHHAPASTWPPSGVRVRMDYQLPEDGLEALVSVHYELYDGLPVFSKWVTVQNRGREAIRLDRVTTEELAVVEHANWVERHGDARFPRPASLHVETDFAFSSFNAGPANRHVVHWRSDPKYTSQVDWERETPCLLVVEPTRGPAQRIEPGETFESYRTFELVHDRGDRERRGLALRRMYRTLAPWVTENPITHHLLSHDPERVMEAIDEAKEVGFEAIILSFGSGFDTESTDPAYLARWTEVADHAAAQGIEIGSYSLFSSRDVGAEHMIVSPDGERPTHGRCPAVTSEWGLGWLDRMRSFYETTGFDQFENDGPYPGDVDVTPRPPLQEGVLDSRWAQWELTAALYGDLRAAGVYINAPDYYYLNGSNKCGMGYREVNWSLPRAQQVIHTRQNIYDGTWQKTPSMGWMHVPLAEYHGGGAAATIEPLHEHLDHYERMLRSNLGLGVQAHYRGPRLFDTPETKERVRSVIAWFKRYRDILESDVIHGRRADGRDLDWMLHVGPTLDEKGMLVVYNPLDVPVSKTLEIDLYYTGIEDMAEVSEGDFRPVRHELERDYTIELDVSVPAGGMSWYVIRGR